MNTKLKNGFYPLGRGEWWGELAGSLEQESDGVRGTRSIDHSGGWHVADELQGPAWAGRAVLF